MSRRAHKTQLRPSAGPHVKSHPKRARLYISANSPKLPFQRYALQPIPLRSQFVGLGFSTRGDFADECSAPVNLSQFPKTYLPKVCQQPFSQRSHYFGLGFHTRSHFADECSAPDRARVSPCANNSWGVPWGQFSESTRHKYFGFTALGARPNWEV